MRTLQTPKYKVLSGSVLKLIAVIVMTIDHTAVMFQQEFTAIDIPFIDFSVFGQDLSLYWLMRLIGRVAFPIYCFLIGEGFRHTRNKKVYGLRLLIFAIISEIPYNLMHNSWLYDRGQNVFFTLFMGLMMIYAHESIRRELVKYLVMAGIGVAAYYLKADYSLGGVLTVFLIYVLQSHPAVQVMLAYPLLNIPTAAVMAFIPINMYNGKRGFIKSPVLKICFYAFYPVHLLVLVGIRRLFFG